MRYFGTVHHGLITYTDTKTKCRHLKMLTCAGTFCSRCLPEFIGYTHKTSGFKMSGFKTSETSGLQNVRFTKCQAYKTSGLQNVRLQKNIHIYSVLVVGGNPQVLMQLCLQAK
jgi:hypothetical protein